MKLNNCSIKALSGKLKHLPFFHNIHAASILKELSFFSDVEETTLKEISDSVLIFEFSENEIICRHGMFDKRFYIIISGKVKAVIPTEHNHRHEIYNLNKGDFFGGKILFPNEPRDTTIIAAEDTMTVSISRDVLKKLVAESENIRSLMDQSCVARKLKRDLRRVSIFTSLSDELFNRIIKKVELLTLPKGKVVFTEGEEGDAFYLIGKGELNVKRNMLGEDRLLSVLGEGQFFGEMSLLMKEKRNATVEVTASADLMKISREAFIEIVEKDKKLMDNFQKIMKERKKMGDDVLSSPGSVMITRKLLDLNNSLYKHFDVFSHCTVETELGSALLATIPDSRYPYVYPRDSACASRFLYKLILSPLQSGDFAFRLLMGVARFILNCQREDGYWGQRYGINGEDKGIYKQEDNVAHGVIILCRYLLAAKFKGKKISDSERIIDAIAKGCEYACKNYYRNGINLFHSTTSIHESAIEEGYSIWVNYAYLLMLRLVERIGLEYDVSERFAEGLDIKNGFESNIENVFSITERFIRRIKFNGDMDLRPDITLMSPFYFCSGMDVDYFSNTGKFVKSIECVEQTLWDPVLGLLQRYLPFVEDQHTHVHAGNGPWIPYTSILAQYYFYIGKIDRGNEILAIIDKYRSPEGHHCEHLTTPRRFDEFIKMEWKNGKDIDKELFTHKIMIPGLSCDFIVEEINHMKKAYEKIEQECRDNRDREYIIFATPLMWSHAEYAMALMMRTEKELEHNKGKKQI